MDPNATLPPGTRRQPRYDLYTATHRALRLFMTETLARVGRLDVNDRHELTTALNEVDALLRLARLHLAHENQYVHAAIEACQPGATQAIGEEHVEQIETMDGLHAEAQALANLPTTPAALRLYQHLVRFVAESFDHMLAEETELNPLLWSHYRDEQLLEIEQRIADATTPTDRALLLRWLVPAITPIERAWRFAQLQRQLKTADFDAALVTAQSVLDARAWNKLKWALGLNAVA
ncbi:hypothetical protein HLB44_04105 [Aquincola sp. S2]|uniref:Hemerythrin-like domain-containing protein n=1 Tax=Pseudaquabacterium terrae TaxID=2732868 RepID=A0ABX2EB96_9BURK|nr:hemerythrin domain-containing protein [Aquabacterium terrae]NRF66158.1 hypothetical protein [Aquabacterium terrae]